MSTITAAATTHDVCGNDIGGSLGHPPQLSTWVVYNNICTAFITGHYTVKPDTLADCWCPLLNAFTSVDLSARSLLLSRTLAHDATMHYSQALFHFLDGATGGLWPIWIFHVADMVFGCGRYCLAVANTIVADMVYGWYGRPPPLPVNSESFVTTFSPCCS